MIYVIHIHIYAAKDVYKSWTKKILHCWAKGAQWAVKEALQINRMAWSFCRI